MNKRRRNACLRQRRTSAIPHDLGGGGNDHLAAANRRIAARVDLVSVKDVLGHRDIQTTLQYAQLAPELLQESVNRGSLSGTVTSQEGKWEKEM